MALLESTPALKARLKQARKSVYAINRFLHAIGKTKVFCVGQNKTGTTSLANALNSLDIPVAPTIHDHDPFMSQMIDDWSQRDFSRIIRHCHFAQAFQDYPYSLPDTFKAMDSAFPRSKFILTVRNSAEQWYESFRGYYLGKYWGGLHPHSSEIAISNPYADYALERMRAIYGQWQDPFDRDKLIQAYESHNNAVLDYFEERPKDLLVVNISDDQDYLRLCRFLGKEPRANSFPWLNRTGN